MDALTTSRARSLLRLVAAGLLADGLRRIANLAWARRAPADSTALSVVEVGAGLKMLAGAPVAPRTLYRVIAPAYDPVMPLWRDWLYRDATRALDDALRASCPSGGHVLDLACGTGGVLERLIATGAPFASYTGVDQSARMLDRARAKFGTMPGIGFEPLDLRSDPLPAGRYDLIASAWALEHLPDPGQVIAAGAGRLQPGGRLVLLFEGDGDAWRERVLRHLWLFFGARLVPESEYARWPGLVSVQRFAAVGPAAVLMILSPRPSNP